MMRTIKLRRVWSRGVADDDSLLMLPAATAMTRQAALLFDAGAQQLRAFSLRDGALLWNIGRAGAGPGEFSRRVTLAADPNGDILVLDRGNGRLIRLDSLGQERSVVPVGHFAPASSHCAARDGTVWVYRHFLLPSLAKLDSAGNVLTTAKLPWPDLERVPPLSRQGVLRAAGGECVFTFLLGEGFARMGGPVWSYHARYIEHFPLPKGAEQRGSQGVTRMQLTREEHYAGRGLASDGPCLLVLFSGATKMRSRVVDAYAARSGRYLYSFELPASATTITGVDGLLAVQQRAAPFPGLSVYAMEPRCRE